MSRSDIAAAMLTRHVMTAIDDATCFDVDSSCEEAAEALAQCDFDNAPVRGADGVVGHVNQLDAERCTDGIRGCLRPLQDINVVSVNAPLSSLLGRLKDHEFLHVVGDDGVVGLVTPSDFNKQAGRAYFYLSVSDFEIRLATCIRSHWPDGDVLVARLPSRRRQQLKSRLEKQRELDVAADTVAAMDFKDLLSIAKSAGLLSGLDVPLRQANSSLDTELVALRNDVMHLVKKMARDRRSSILRLSELDRQLQRLLDEVATATASLAGAVTVP